MTIPAGGCRRVGGTLTVAAAEIGADDPIVIEVFAARLGAFSGLVEAESEHAVVGRSTVGLTAIVP